MNYLFDTNVLLFYLRGGETARKLDLEWGIISPKNRIMASVVSIGELKAIAMRNKWGRNRVRAIEEVMRDFLILDINTTEILDKYAEIDAFSQGKHPNLPLALSARNMGKNDLWIAATASVYDLTLLTTDNDFSHLSETFLTLNILSLS